MGPLVRIHKPDSIYKDVRLPGVLQGLCAVGRGALAGQAGLPRLVGVAEQDAGLVVGVVAVAAPGPLDVLDGGVRGLGAGVGHAGDLDGGPPGGAGGGVPVGLAR